MTENAGIGDESLENASNPESVKPSDQDIPSVAADTISPKEKSENMEVHHHPNVEKKTIKEYLLEGLMIFLAVMMGFIAENVREEITEHQRAKVFALSMVNDLKADTVGLKQYIAYMTYAANNVDTLLNMLSTKNPKDIASGKLYWYGLWGGAQAAFIPNDATFQQMKSSGSLRYFTNSSLAEKIAQYDQLCRRTQTNDEMNRALYTEVRKSRAQIFEFKYNIEANDIYQANKLLFSQQKIDSFVHTNPPLLTYDKTLFNQYVELVRSRSLVRNVTNADSLLSHALVLISELRNEYHLE